MNFRLAGIDPTSVRFGCTGWRTVRSSWALYSSEKPVIDPESCEMTVSKIHTVLLGSISPSVVEIRVVTLEPQPHFTFFTLNF